MKVEASTVSQPTAAHTQIAARSGSHPTCHTVPSMVRHCQQQQAQQQARQQYVGAAFDGCRDDAGPPPFERGPRHHTVLDGERRQQGEVHGECLRRRSGDAVIDGAGHTDAGDECDRVDETRRGMPGNTALRKGSWSCSDAALDHRNPHGAFAPIFPMVSALRPIRARARTCSRRCGSRRRSWRRSVRRDCAPSSH